MQGGQVVELGLGQTFQAGVGGMGRPRQVGRFEPETQGFGIDAKEQATIG
jgi:hypothetical protein